MTKKNKKKQKTAGSVLWDDKPIITNLTIPKCYGAARIVFGENESPSS